MAPKIINLFLVAFCLSFPHSIQATIAQFKLYTPGSSSPEKISAGNLGNKFNPNEKLTFIVHGYLQTSEMRWIPKMRTELMKREKMNIVVVEWSQGSVHLYPIAVKNTRVVGSEIAALIQQLHRRYNYTLSEIHVIGHSLGAHVAGFAGAKVQAILAGKKLGRITGLDPARPQFDHNDERERLDPSDAQFVDILHTNVGGLGLERPCGHLDFYPNGGKDQPGCTKKGFLLSKLFKAVLKLSPKDVCDHMKAIKFFTASINNNQCSREAIPCANWETFKQAKCNECTETTCTYMEMGYNADQYQDSSVSKSSRKFYLKTLNSYPYCSPPFSYHVTLENVKVKAGSFFARNEIIIQLHGENGDSFPVSLSNAKSGTVSHVIISKKKLHPLQDISISYKGGSKKSATMYLGKVTINGPHSKYTAVFNTRLSSRIVQLFFFIDVLDFKTYKRPLRKISKNV